MCFWITTRYPRPRFRKYKKEVDLRKDDPFYVVLTDKQMRYAEKESFPGVKKGDIVFTYEANPGRKAKEAREDLIGCPKASKTIYAAVKVVGERPTQENKPFYGASHIVKAEPILQIKDKKNGFSYKDINNMLGKIWKPNFQGLLRIDDKQVEIITHHLLKCNVWYYEKW